MKTTSLFVLLFLAYGALPAQAPPGQYDIILRNIERTFLAEQYDSTLLHIRAARAWAPEKEGEIEDWNDRVFEAIRTQRDQAVENQKRAEAAEKNAKRNEARAIAAAEKAAAAEAEAKKQAQRAKREKDRAQAVLDKIYFYKGRFGLAANEYGSKYGFIDRELNTKIDFKYDEALPFDYTGFARVKRENQNFLIDTTGREYPVANDVSQLGTGITALDLRNRDLDSLSSKVFGQQGLEVLLLSQNQLSELPPEIGQLAKLSSLELGGNQLDSLPKEMENLKELELLYLNSNDFKVIPSVISQLTNLKAFSIGGNEINEQQIIELITLVPGIETLYLGDLKLTRLPDEVAKLKNLKKLDLSNYQDDPQTANTFSAEEQKRIKGLLPDCEVIFER